VVDVVTFAEPAVIRPPRRVAPATDVSYVLFHHAGGASSVFHEWHTLLADAGRVVAPDLPGRRRRIRETPIRDAEQAVRDLVSLLDEQHVTPPYVLLGHSMGAVLAYEVAKAWQASGRPEPEALYVSGSRPPHLYRGEHWCAGLDDDALRAETARWSGGSRMSVQSSSPHQLALLRADLAVCRDYRWTPRAPLSCPVVAFTGTADPIATTQQMGGWADYTAGPFTHRVVTGHHFFLYEPETSDHVRSALRSHSAAPRTDDGDSQ